MKRALILFALVSVAGGLKPAGLLQPAGEQQAAGTRVDWHPLGYVAYQAAGPVAVDGKLDDGPWKSASWSDPFVDIEGDARPRPLHQTRVKMLWDQNHFYIGAELVEPHLWATLTEHDSVIFRDNDFEVFIDPNGDNHEYYELEINALGTTWDLLLPKPYKDDGKAVNGWEIAGMKSAVHLDGTLNNPRDTDRGWTVELALPWKALGELARRPSPPKDGDQWRVNFSRVQWPLDVVNGVYRKRSPASSQSEPARAEWGEGDPASERVGGMRGGEAPRQSKEFNWVWSPQHVIDMHRPEQWGYVQFSTAASGTAKFVLDSTWPIRKTLHSVYYAQRDYRKAHGRWAASLSELNVGVPGPAGARPALVVAGDQFQVSLAGWHIRHDSLIWKN